MASIYLPPIARKKKVDGWPRENTTRVFADLEVDVNQEIPSTSYGTQFIRHNVPPPPQRTNSANRKNKPQPTAVTFLRQNPRFVCEPICHVDTSVNADEYAHPWWPNETIERPVTMPQYTLNSTSRGDYQDNSYYLKTGFSRYDYSPALTRSKPALGVVPGWATPRSTPSVNEKISYEHQYNCRLDPSHPIRGKRHGCFVWKVVSPPKGTQSRSRTTSSNSSERRSVSYELTSENVDDVTSDTKPTDVSPIAGAKGQSSGKGENTSMINGTIQGVNAGGINKSEAWSADQGSLMNTTTEKDNLRGKADDGANTNIQEALDSFNDEFPVYRPHRPKRQSPPPHVM